MFMLALHQIWEGDTRHSCNPSIQSVCIDWHGRQSMMVLIDTRLIHYDKIAHVKTLELSDRNRRIQAWKKADTVIFIYDNFQHGGMQLAYGDCKKDPDEGV